MSGCAGGHQAESEGDDTDSPPVHLAVVALRVGLEGPTRVAAKPRQCLDLALGGVLLHEAPRVRDVLLLDHCQRPYTRSERDQVRRECEHGQNQVHLTSSQKLSSCSSEPDNYRVAFVSTRAPDELWRSRRTRSSSAMTSKESGFGSAMPTAVRAPTSAGIRPRDDNGERLAPTVAAAAATVSNAAHTPRARTRTRRAGSVVRPPHPAGYPEGLPLA